MQREWPVVLEPRQPVADDTTLPEIIMEVENRLFVEENRLPRGRGISVSV